MSYKFNLEIFLKSLTKYFKDSNYELLSCQSTDTNLTLRTYMDRKNNVQKFV
jgi:hypothetical protein